MKKLSLLLLLGCLGFAGCARHYVVKLSNDAEIDAWGKPQLKDGSYHYKDGQGQACSLPGSRVKEIRPASMARDEHKAPARVKQPAKRHWYYLWLA